MNERYELSFRDVSEVPLNCLGGRRVGQQEHEQSQLCQGKWPRTVKFDLPLISSGPPFLGLRDWWVSESAGRRCFLRTDHCSLTTEGYSKTWMSSLFMEHRLINSCSSRNARNDCMNLERENLESIRYSKKSNDRPSHHACRHPKQGPSPIRSTNQVK